MKIIGIDPDIDKCGVCLLVNGEISDLKSVPTHQLIRCILVNNEFAGFKYCIEDTLKTSAIYTKNRKQSSKVNEKIALSVGKVQGVTKILIDVINHKNGEKPILAPPGVGKKYKKNSEAFKRDFDWEHGTNEDQRDAALIACYANKLLRSK